MKDRAVAGVRRRAALVALAAGGSATGAARGSTLPAPGSLPDALASALRTRQPLVVMASTGGCPWCQLVREHYLAPLRREQHLPVVQLDIGSRAALLDFGGHPTTHDELLRRWQVRVAPTLLFLGRDGREIAPRLAGVAADFYGAYLDHRLAAARRSLGQEHSG